MAKITVYNFSLYDPQQDAWINAKGKCTAEKIESEGGRLFKETAEDIDDSQLTQSERYYYQTE